MAGFWKIPGDSAVQGEKQEVALWLNLWEGTKNHSRHAHSPGSHGGGVDSQEGSLGGAHLWLCAGEQEMGICTAPCTTGCPPSRPVTFPTLPLLSALGSFGPEALPSLGPQVFLASTWVWAAPSHLRAGMAHGSPAGS